MKRYYMMFQSDKTICGSNEHVYSMSNSISGAKSSIKRCRKMFESDRPRNFRIYDTMSEIDPKTNFVQCVYQED